MASEVETYVPKHAPTVGHGDFVPLPPAENGGNGWKPERPPWWLGVLAVLCMAVLFYELLTLGQLLYDVYVKGGTDGE